MADLTRANQMRTTADRISTLYRLNFWAIATTLARYTVSRQFVSPMICIARKLTMQQTSLMMTTIEQAAIEILKTDQASDEDIREARMTRMFSARPKPFVRVLRRIRTVIAVRNRVGK
jgi:ribosomal protein L17